VSIKCLFRWCGGVVVELTVVAADYNVDNDDDDDDDDDDDNDDDDDDDKIDKDNYYAKYIDDDDGGAVAAADNNNDDNDRQRNHRQELFMKHCRKLQQLKLHKMFDGVLFEVYVTLIGVQCFVSAASSCCFCQLGKLPSVYHSGTNLVRCSL